MSVEWKYKKLGDVCKTGAGGTPLKSHKEYYRDGSIPWIRSGEVNNRDIRDSEIKITELGLSNSSAKLFPPRTVVIAMYGATAGEVGILNIESSTNQAVCGIYPNPNFVPEFLYYFFLKFKDELIAQAVGNAQPNISQAKIKNTLIPVISVQEQEYIVAVLDQVFEAIDQAKANIERNIENAKELFQSKLNEIFSQRGEGWEEKSLGKACKITMGQSPKGTSYNSEGLGVPLINGPVEFGPKPFSKTIMSKWTTEPTKMCQEGDLILCVRGSTTGRINIAGFSGCIGRGVASIRYEKNQEWINFFIRCNQQTIFKLGTGSTFPNVSSKILSALKFSEPQSNELQNVLIQKMIELEIDCNEVVEKYKQKSDSLDELRKSILQKAFAGELTSASSVTKGKEVEV